MGLRPTDDDETSEPETDSVSRQPGAALQTSRKGLESSVAR